MKTVIVTGASTGIGKGIAREFIKNGWNTVVNSITESRLREAYSDLGNPANVLLFAGDISDRQVSKGLVDAARRRFGSVDVLVNNAGIFGLRPFLETEEDYVDQFYRNNFKSTFFTTKEVIPDMLKAGGGSILNIGSVLVDHAITGLPTTAAISIKGAIHAFTRQLAAEFGASNIRVNAIAPGTIRTELQRKLGITDPDAAANLSLLNRIGEPNHIARMAYEMSVNEFITGEVVNIDGGHVAGH